MHIIVDTQSDARSGERRWTFESLPAEIAFEDRHCERVWSSRGPCRTAIDVKTGAVLWKHVVSAPALALPAIYSYKGKQHVPFAAGGNSILTAPGFRRAGRVQPRLSADAGADTR